MLRRSDFNAGVIGSDWGFTYRDDYTDPCASRSSRDWYDPQSCPTNRMEFTLL